MEMTAIPHTEWVLAHALTANRYPYDFGQNVLPAYSQPLSFFRQVIHI